MPLPVSETSGGNFKKVPQGTHAAVCNMVVDLGLQESTFGTKHQVYLRFEIPGERIEWEKDGQKHEGPMTIGATYTASLSEKANLRRDLESWRGRAFTADELKAFDVFKVLGAPCLITVTHKESGPKVYANITGITALPKGMDKPIAENELLRYSPDEPQDFEKLPEWLQKKIETQVEDTKQQVPHSDPALVDEFGDRVPF